VKHGVHILENIKTEELVADKAYEFFFVLAAPRFKGPYKALCTRSNLLIGIGEQRTERWTNFGAPAHDYEKRDSRLWLRCWKRRKVNAASAYARALR
jgi:hypothetical protein